MLPFAFASNVADPRSYNTDDAMSHSLRFAVPIICAVAFPFAWAGAAGAAADCANATSTAAMVACAQRELEQHDARLNDVYKRLMAPNRLDGPARDLLRTAQRAWIAFRDADCAWSADAMRGGTGASVLAASCLAEHTRRRADALEAELAAR